MVTTTIDPKMQAEAERALTDELNAKGAKFGVEQGRAGGARSRRRGQGDGRRTQLRRQPVQPRGRGQAPARLVVQAVRLSGGAGEGPDARHRARRRADLGQGMEPGKLLARIFRTGDADQGAVALAQHGRRAPRPGSRAEGGGRRRPPARHHVRPRCRPLDRARLFRSHAARDGFRLCGVRQRRHRRPAACDRESAHRRRQAALRAAQRQLRPGHRPAICGDDERR